MIPNVATCSRCIMDATAPDIRFDEQGVCYYCKGFVEKKAKHVALSEEERVRRDKRACGRLN